MPAFAWNVVAASDQVISSNIADDLLAAINAVFAAGSGATGAFWEVATYQSTSPRYVILKRKNGAAGRIVIFGQQGSTPNAAAVTGTPGANLLYIGYSATSTSDTIDTSWLSGAPLSAGDYMPGLRCCLQTAATWRVSYAEFADGLYIMISNTSNGGSIFGAGDLLQDLSGTAIPTVHASGQGGMSNWATSAASTAIWPSAVGSSASYTTTDSGLLLRTGGTNRLAFRAMVLGTNVDTKLNDPAATICFFFPIYVVFHNSDSTLTVAGKVRQVGFGPRCDRETIRTEGGVNAYGHQFTSSGATYPGIWLVDAEL